MEQASEALLLDCVRAGVHEVLPLAWRPGATLPLRHVGVDGALLPAARHALPGIASAREMPRMQADAEFFGLLLRTFVDEVPARLADLGAHWPAQPQRVASLCHALKSVARSLGMDALGDCAAATEKAAAAATALWHHGLWETLEAEIWSARYQALRWLHLAADTNG